MASPSPVPPVAGRTLERLEQMRLRLLGKTRPSVGDLDDDDRAFAPAGDADLVAAGVAGGAAFQRLRGVACEVQQDAEELVVVGFDHEAALDRADPADRASGLRPSVSCTSSTSGSSRSGLRSGGGSCRRP